MHGDQLHSGSEGLPHGGEGGDLIIGEGEGRRGHNVSADSHNHGAGGEVSSNGHNSGDQGDEGGGISCSSSLATSKSSDLPAGPSDASHSGGGSIHGSLTLGQSSSLGLQSIHRDRAGGHGGDCLVLKLPAGGESVLASLACCSQLGGSPAGAGIRSSGLLAQCEASLSSSDKSCRGVNTLINKGHVGHGEVGGAGGIDSNLAVKQSPC